MRKRNLEIDILSCLATALIIIGHCAYYQVSSDFGGINLDDSMWQYVGYDTKIHQTFLCIVDTIYLFHTRLFLMVSGAVLYLSSPRQLDDNAIIKNFCKKRAKRLLVPYVVVFTFILMPIRYIVGYYSINGLSVLTFLKRYIMEGMLITGNNYLWYLWVLFAGSVAIVLGEKYIHLSVKAKIVLLYLLRISQQIIPITHSIGIIYMFVDNFVYLYIGYVFMPHLDRIKKSSKPALGWFSFIILLGMAILLRKLELLPLFSIAIHEVAIWAGCITMWYIMLWVERHISVNWKECKTYGMGLYLYTDPLNYLILWGVMQCGKITLLGNEWFAFALILLRTIGISCMAVVIVNILRKCKLTYLC